MTRSLPSEYPQTDSSIEHGCAEGGNDRRTWPGVRHGATAAADSCLSVRAALPPRSVHAAAGIRGAAGSAPKEEGKISTAAAML